MDNLHAYRNGSIILMDFANHGTLLSVILAFKHATVSLRQKFLYL